MSTTPYLTPPELARIWRCKVEKIHGFITKGELRAVNLAANRSGRPRWKIPPEAVTEFELKRTATPAVKPIRRRQKMAGVIEFF